MPRARVSHAIERESATSQHRLAVRVMVTRAIFHHRSSANAPFLRGERQNWRNDLKYAHTIERERRETHVTSKQLTLGDGQRSSTSNSRKIVCDKLLRYTGQQNVIDKNAELKADTVGWHTEKFSIISKRFTFPDKS